MHAWHDPAGLTILLVCLFGLWGISLFFRRHSEPLPEPALSSTYPSPSFSMAWLLGFAVCLVLAEAGVGAWYDWHQRTAVESNWAVRWPDDHSSYQKIAIPPESEALLQYNEGGGATWTGADGHAWVLYHFQWLPGRTAALFVKTHRPDICLPASGMVLGQDDGIHFFEGNGVKLPIRTYRFENGANSLHVAYCYWDARSSYENAHASTVEDWTAKGRLRAALRGQRERGAQMLELGVWGYETDEEARQALHQQLLQVIRRG